MSKDRRQSEPRSTDARLKSFLREASAIIATEKGLNSSSRVKLQSLAKHKKLPQRLFDTAMERLQANSLATVDLNRYESAFMKFLQSEFAKLNGGVLAPDQEYKAIQIAKDKYQIAETRAEQLIFAQAESDGVSLISHEDARLFAQQIIVEQIGNATELDDQFRQSQYKVGRKWGLEQASVDQVVLHQLALNRAAKRTKWKKIAFALLLLCVSIGALGFAYQANLLPGLNADVDDIPDSPDDGLATETDRATLVPQALLAELETLAEADSSIATISKLIQSDQESQRGQGYRQLIEVVCQNEHPQENAIFALVAKLFSTEPSENAAQEITDSVWQFLESRPPSSVQDLKSAYRANGLVCELCFAPRRENADAIGRFQKLNDDIFNRVGVSVSVVEDRQAYFQLSEEMIATDQWSQLFQQSWSSPKTAALLITPLYELTRPKMKDAVISQCRDESLLSIIHSDPSSWRAMENTIRESLKTCDEFILRQWIAVFVQSADDSFKNGLAKPLQARTGVTSDQSNDDVVAAIEKFDMLERNNSLRAVIDRSEMLEQRVRKILSTSLAIDRPELVVDQIAQLALAVNAEFAFCQSVQQSAQLNDATFREFDRLMELPAPRLREQISLPIDRRKSTTAETGAATASDRRRFDSSLDRLSNLEPDASGLRILAVNQLERVAHRFSRISYAEAEILADYFLADLGVEETLNNEKMIGAFSHWPNLALAIADKLPQSDTQIDQALTVSRLLLSTTFETERGTDWREELKIDILVYVTKRLQSQLQQDPDDSQTNWARLKIYLLESYRERLAIYSGQNESSQNYVTPHQPVIDLVRKTRTTNIAASDSFRIDRVATLIEEGSTNQIEKIALANEQLIENLVDELSRLGAATAASKAVAELKLFSQSHPLVSDSLYATERCLLKLMDMKRELLVDQMMHGG